MAEYAIESINLRMAGRDMNREITWMLGGLAVIAGALSLACIHLFGVRSTDDLIRSNEKFAEMSLFNIEDAQRQHKEIYSTEGLFAESLEVLRNAEGPLNQPILLIDERLASGEMLGYMFRLIQENEEGVSYDITKSWACCAVPSVYGETGKKTFIVDNRGDMYMKDLGGNAPVQRWPAADLQKEGWVKNRRPW